MDEDGNGRKALSVINNVPTLGGNTIDWSKWKLKLSTTLDEVIVYPIPALLYLVKNLLQYYILEHVDAPGYQILKNLNVISTGVSYRIIHKEGFFYGYSFITILMILNQALSGLAVSMVMKYADNIVKVYSTSVAMLFTTFVSYYLFAFDISYAFIFGTAYVNFGYMRGDSLCISTYCRKQRETPHLSPL